MAKDDKKDSVQMLKEALRAGSYERLYIFHGAEVFLLQHYLERLKKALLDELTESFNYHRMTQENFDMRSFADAVENLPMMAEHTLVQVDDVDLFKLPEDERNKAAEILADIPDYCTVVFTYETVAWSPEKRQKKLWDAVSSGQIVEFAKQSQRDLITWVGRHFAARKKQISPELCAYLIELTDGTMTALSSEIAKIVAFSGADTICRADIDAVTEPVVDAVVYRLGDQIADGDCAQALATLQKLFIMQEEPLGILGSIGSHFRRIATARSLLDHGKGHQELVKLYSMNSDYPAKKAVNAARRVSNRFCARAAELILETDYRMKTSFDEPQRLLELLIMAMCLEVRQ